MKTISCRFVLALLIAAAPAAYAADNLERIWTGTYTDAQAERGAHEFEKSCAWCHGPTLAGVNGPSLKGDRFLKAWDFRTVNSLFTKARESMPPNAVESVSNQSKLDVIAFILKQNGFPSASSELTVDSKLDEIPILKKGVTVLPNFVLVAMVGCVEQANGNWVLTKASDPVLTQDRLASAALLSDAAAKPLGNANFVLVSSAAFHPSSLSGARVEARGLLYRDANENRVNLSSLKRVAESCSN